MTTTIGDRLRRYRKRCKYSAEQLSKKIKKAHPDTTLSRQVISNIENNRRVELTLSEIIALSQAMGIPPIALVCDVERPFDYCDNAYLQHLKNYEVVFMFALESFSDGGNGTMAQASHIWKAMFVLSINRRALEGMEKTMTMIIKNDGSTETLQEMQESIDKQKAKIVATSKVLQNIGLNTMDSAEMKRFEIAFDKRVEAGASNMGFID